MLRGVCDSERTWEARRLDFRGGRGGFWGSCSPWLVLGRMFVGDLGLRGLGTELNGRAFGEVCEDVGREGGGIVEKSKCSKGMESPCFGVCWPGVDGTIVVVGLYSVSVREDLRSWDDLVGVN